MNKNYKYNELENLILEKYNKESFTKLSFIQKKSYKVLARKRHSLIVAPTGSGKTESAILPVIALIAKGREINTKPNGIKCLYITPQRSLNNDVFRRIIKYANSENLKVSIRHGDTSYTKRKKIIEDPPDILITTPESLAIVLVNNKMTDLLKDLQWVILDEIHEIISSKRGSYLSLCLERLSFYSKNICRIGLSATIGDLKTTSKFLVGNNRKCAVIVDKSLRKYDIDLRHIEGSVHKVSKYILDYVNQNYTNSSVLLFTNTRDESEFIGSILKNEANINIHVHHGSLSKNVREETESSLRSGFKGIVVCTSSLELGLDIGSIDLVIHYGSPRQVSKLIQRIGRSRHTSRLSAKGLIITNNYDDFIESLGIIHRVRSGSIEEQLPHICALDVLAHNIVGIVLQNKEPVNIDLIYELLKSSYLYSTLSYHDFNDCLTILSNSFLIKINKIKNLVSKSGKSLLYYYENVSTIPHVVKFEVIDSISKKKIGSLDQQFVGDYGEKGNVFVLKGSQWRIISVDENKLQVYVEPLSGAPVNIPYWVGEMIPVDYHTARKVGWIRTLISKSSDLEIKKILPIDRDLLANIVRIFNKIIIVPNHNNIVIESYASENIVVMHSTLGTKINNTLGSLLSTYISSRTGYIVEYRSDPYRILLSSQNIRIRKNHIFSLFDDDFDIESVLITSFSGTYNMNWKVWGISKRFGIINKDSIYDKRIARMLFDKYYKSSISKESIRELIHDKYDVKRTTEIVSLLKSKKIVLHWIDNEEVSDLALPILSHSKRSVSAPLNLENGILELINERLTKTKHKLICIRCGKWERIFETKDIPEKLFCPICRSKLIAVTFWSDSDLKNIIGRRLAGNSLSKEEEHKFDRAWKIASLVNNFGKLAIFVLSGHGIGVDTCARILRNYVDEKNLLKTIYETEKQYITTRGFWNN